MQQGVMQQGVMQQGVLPTTGQLNGEVHPTRHATGERESARWCKAAARRLLEKCCSM
jgi:hypothetical protein